MLVVPIFTYGQLLDYLTQSMLVFPITTYRQLLDRFTQSMPVFPVSQLFKAKNK